MLTCIVSSLLLLRAPKAEHAHTPTHATAHTTQTTSSKTSCNMKQLISAGWKRKTNTNNKETNMMSSNQPSVEALPVGELGTNTCFWVRIGPKQPFPVTIGLLPISTKIVASLALKSITSHLPHAAVSQKMRAKRMRLNLVACSHFGSSSFAIAFDSIMYRALLVP